MRHLSILSVFFFMALIFLVDPVQGTAQTVVRPNIVLILADDLGWADLGSYGADLHETPHLDQLARQGVRFTQAYAMSVCTPTRAAMLTGKHAARLNLTIWREGSVGRDAEVARTKNRLLAPSTIHNLGADETTIAELLHATGYLTFHVGKWHLGDAANAPERHGFDLNIGGTHWGAPATFFWPFRGNFGQSGEFRYVPGLGLGREGDYLTDRLTEEAISLIDQAGSRPFFLNLWYHNPHTPIEGKPSLTAKYRQRLKPEFHHQNPDYAAMIETLDANVGRIMGHLQKKKLAAQTLFVFTSDNGGYVNSYKGVQVTSNAPLRSGKGSLYEGGVRVPLIISWAGVTPPGTVIDQPVVCMDLFRTFAEVAGVTQESGVDGLSLFPLLRNPAVRLDRDSLFFHYPHYYPTTTPVSAMREGDWKLLEYFEDQRVELYHLRDDPGEKTDLSPREPAQTSRLRRRLDEWRRAVNAQMPTVNPNARP